MRHLGIAGFEFSDGRTVVLADPAVTRPTVLELLRGPLRPDPGLQELWCPRADFILVTHAHYDHAVDMPGIALRTGASVVGTRATLDLARSRGVPESKLIEAVAGRELRLGSFRVAAAAATHTRLLGRDDLMTGGIRPDAGPLWFWQYRQDGSFSYRLEAGGTSVWLHPATPYAPGELGGRPADTLILGVSGLPWTAARAKAILAEVRPKRVLPTHFDNFFQPLAKGLALMPGLDFESARRSVAEADPALPWILLEPGETLR